MNFSEEKLNKVNEIISRYPEGKQKSAILASIAFGARKNLADGSMCLQWIMWLLIKY